MMKFKMNKLVQLSAVIAAAAMGGFAAQMIMPQKAQAHDYQYNSLNSQINSLSETNDGLIETMSRLTDAIVKNKERITELEAEIEALKQ